MGLISRVSSRTYRKKPTLVPKMAKGTRNKKRQKAARIRREKFAPREAAKIAEIAPNLEEIRARLAEQKALDLENEKLKKLEQENNNGMDDENSKKADPNSFDPVTKKTKMEIMLL